MLFQYGAHSALLLPFVVPGLVLVLHLLVRAARFGALPDGLLALLLFLNVLPVAQWMLGYAGWYDSHDGYSTAMFYVPWQTSLAWGPAFYLYFRSLTNQEFRLRRHWRHLLPALAFAGLYAGAAVYDLVWGRWLHGQALPYHFGTKGEAANFIDSLSEPVGWLGVIQNYAAPSLLTDAGLCCSRLEGLLEQQQKDHRVVLNYTRLAGLRLAAGLRPGHATAVSALSPLPRRQLFGYGAAAVSGAARFAGGRPAGPAALVGV